MRLLVLRPPNPVVICRALVVCLAALDIQRVAATIDDPTVQWMQTVLDAWGVACRSNLRIPQDPLPWIIIYDEDHAWHVNPERKLLPQHKRLSRALRFSGRAYDVFEVVHQGKVWVPGRDPIAVAAKAVAMPYADDTKPFFIMGSPAFQQRALRAGASQDFTNLMTGLALHELTHTRQLPQVVPQIKRLQARHRYPDSIDDNLIQTAFKANDEFRSMYDEERKHFSAAVLASDSEAARAEVAEGLRIVERRRQRFFVGEYEGWSEMEDVFLALEGSAMWVQFQSALRLAPKGQPWLDTLAILGQRTDAWSQEEGLVLFLLIDRFRPGWQAKFFGKVLPSPLKELRDAVAPAPL